MALLDFFGLALRHFCSLALYFFGFALCLVPLAIAGSALQATFRLLMHVATLRRATFSISTQEARPGETVHARAEVTPRGARPVRVDARLTCTMFDHQAHELYASSRTMEAAGAGNHKYAADLVVPPYALRTGRVGDKAPNPFSERAHRMMVVWTVDFAVRSARGKLLYRQSKALRVPLGRRLQTHFRRMSFLATDTFSSTRNDMLFNWLVHLAATDGPLVAAERAQIHELVSEMDGMSDTAEVDRRIDREIALRLVIDRIFLQRYVPIDERLEFYRALYTLARADGPINEKEQKFLADALKAFGITRDDVKAIEEEATRATEPKS